MMAQWPRSSLLRRRARFQHIRLYGDRICYALEKNAMKIQVQAHGYNWLEIKRLLQQTENFKFKSTAHVIFIGSKLLCKIYFLLYFVITPVTLFKFTSNYRTLVKAPMYFLINVYLISLILYLHHVVVRYMRYH